MAQNILRSSTRACTAKHATCLVRSARYSNKATGWFRRFLSPSEEKELYLGITSSFRDKLVEQSNKSAQNYSHIIEHALLSAKPASSKVSKTGMLSLARMEQLKLDLDAAGKQKDVSKLQQLELEMDHAHLNTVTMYNRLIRAYLWSHRLDLAQLVLDGFEERGLVPTTRTYTYLIQAHLKKDQISQAKALVEQMQHLSLLGRLRNDFDCNIMLKYYKTCGDSHAVEFLWRDMMMHIDTIKPGTASFTLYLEHLLGKQQQQQSAIAQLTQDYLLQQHQQQAPQNLHQYTTWMKVVELLATINNKEYTQKAERLLLYLIKRAPPKTSWDKAKGAIGHVVGSYLVESQELKALAFYYRLQKMGVPDQAFEPALMRSIESVLKKAEQEGDDKAIIAELECLVVSHH